MFLLFVRYLHPR